MTSPLATIIKTMADLRDDSFRAAMLAHGASEDIVDWTIERERAVSEARVRPDAVAILRAIAGAGMLKQEALSATILDLLRDD